MQIGLVSDSPADIPPALVARYNIQIIPAILILDGKEYIDGKDISREEFYNRLPSLRQPPRTAAPSPADYAACYQTLLNAGANHVLSLHTSEKLTSIPNIARLAAQDFPHRVTVLESGSLTLGTGYQVLAAAQAIEEGAALPTILEQIRLTRLKVRVGAALDTMDYLRRSGRIPATITALGGMLNIKPVGELREGVFKIIRLSRTTSQATQALHQFLLAQTPLQRLAILHTNAPQRAQTLLQLLQEQPNLPPMQEIPLINVTSQIGAHLGPNGLGFAALQT